MKELLSQPWPWYISGPLIGLMVPALLILANRHFGISTTFRHICAACIPSGLKFFQYDWKKESWMLFLALGIVLGGWIGGVLLENPEPLALSDAAQKTLSEQGFSNYSKLQPLSLFNFSNATGLVLLILGGFLVGFGTRWANGCTAGHAIMGLSLLSLASFIAVIGFFIGGLAITHFVYPYLF